MLIPGAEGEPEVDQEDDPELRGEGVEAAAAGDHEGGGEEAEDRAEAPTVTVRIGEGDRAEGACEERGEVEGDETGRADRGLEQFAEDVEGKHVEADVEQAGMEE